MYSELREQDRWLPIANVARLMKGTLPTTAKVSKDAKECMQECVSEFISFVTSEASDRCILDKRKTINGEDILYSLNTLGFENYSEILKIYLAKYREQQALRQDRGEYKKKPAKKSKVQSDGDDNENDNDHEDDDIDESRKVAMDEEEINTEANDDSKKNQQEDQQFFRYPADEEDEENEGQQIAPSADELQSSVNNISNEGGDGQGHNSNEEYVQQLYVQDYGDQSKIYTHNSQYHNDPSNPHFIKREMDDGLTLLKDVELDTKPDEAEQIHLGSVHSSRANSGVEHVGSHDDSISSTNLSTQQPVGSSAMLDNKSVSVADEATLSLNLNDNVNGVVVSETEELASLTNGHHGENVLYRYQNDF